MTVLAILAAWTAVSVVTGFVVARGIPPSGGGWDGSYNNHNGLIGSDRAQDHA